MYTKYDAVPVAKIPATIVFGWLTQRRDVLFLRAGEVGLIWFVDIMPGRAAEMGYMFWDQKLGAPRREVLKGAILSAFSLFQLEKLQTRAAEKNLAMRTVAGKHLGFKLEGQLRKGWSSSEDLFIYGMLKNEQPWLALPLPKISLG